MIQNKRIGQYLLYAIGEIILVVLGILIALQVNNWNQNRKQILLEDSYYRSIISDLRNDSLEYDRKAFNAKRNIGKLDNILNFINNEYSFEGIELDSFHYIDPHHYGDTLALLFSVSQAGFLQFPQIYPNTIQDLRSTGNIKILRNQDLKTEILDYYNLGELHDQWVEQLESARNSIELDINSILKKDERVAYTLPKKLTTDEIDFDDFISKLKRRSSFIDNMTGMYHIHHRIIFQSERRLEQLNALVLQISKELD